MGPVKPSPVIIRWIRRQEMLGQERKRASSRLRRVAAEHGVSAKWLRLIAFGSLEDPEFVRAIRQASKSPRVWALVSPAAKEALLDPTVKIEALGGALLDLLGHLEHHTLELVNFWLTEALRTPRDQDADDGRKMRLLRLAAQHARRREADRRAEQWKQEVESRKAGQSKDHTYRVIAQREKLKSGDAVRKRIDRLNQRKRTPTE
jgi:hypothetical protein